ncbi:hypothetical protein BCV69DRAFT_123051 [Microstroma glucosiphilum]|uniref:Uncharacterized protein n=1 Tax=Pseudomicrostroma glucosiphilum TaxID=1684307 RepID=A0A316TWK4_9BASI|nr:hypothetical protein BCV69DRAFT_123051 [Pseudomicrostroma glucosiphilum]PWN17819.1 hypothetical protein BCV69DRAFT_123051 [Pseudomicrostroma glucosiphilum]
MILISSVRPSLAVIRHVLRDHLRSLFASSSPGAVNEEGRLRHERAHLSNSAKMSAYLEGEKWKGKQRTDIPGLDMARSDGAGSHLTLKVCLNMIATLSSSRKQKRPNEEPWEALWPLIVPPLVTLIEDSDPVWRERGTRLLVEQVLTRRTPGSVGHKNLSASELQAVPVQLLQRSNLVPLLQTTLFNSLTYLSHPVGASLLHYALSALILLARSLSERSRERAEMLMRILQEGVLRTWTFMPKSTMPTSLDQDEEEGGEGEEPATEIDVLTTTFTHLTSLCIELEILSARFLDVALDFLSAQISGLYESLVSSTSTSASVGANAKTFAGLVDVEQERKTTRAKLLRGREAVRASRVLVEQACTEAIVEPTAVTEEEHKSTPHPDQATSKDDPFFPTIPPGLAQWTSKCLSAYVKAWLALSDAPLLQSEGARTSPLEREKDQLAEELKSAIQEKVVAAEPSLQDLFAAL